MRLLSALLLTCALLFGGCSKPDGQASKEVVVYMYSEYIDPDMPRQFKQLTGKKLRIDVYESTEDMLAKLQQGGGAGQYDVIVASDVAIPALIKLNLVQPLDLAKIPNAKNVADQFRNTPFDPGHKYGLPYQWGTVGLMYSKSAVKTADVSWSLVFDPAQQPGPFILMDSMRDMLGIALKYQGKSMNTRNPAEVAAAGELLLAAKKSPKFRAFEGGVGGKNSVMNGSAALAVCYNGDALRAVAENDQVAFAVPKEGGIIWVDLMLVSAQAPDREGAHQFMNYILDPKVGAQLSNFMRYATPNAQSLPLIRSEDRQNPGIYPPEQIIQKLEYLQDLDQDTRIYDEVWTTVKSR